MKSESEIIKDLLLEYGNQSQYGCLCDFLVSKLENDNDDKGNKGVPTKDNTLAKKR